MTGFHAGWRTAGWMLLVVVCLVLTGCGLKLTKANYDKVQNGMTMDEVKKLLGKGELETGDGSNVAGQFGVAVMPTGGGGGDAKTYVWESGNKKITISFRDGKVIHKKAEGL